MLRGMITALKNSDLHTMNILNRDLYAIFEAKIPPVQIAKNSYNIEYKTSSSDDLLTEPLHQVLNQIVLCRTALEEKADAFTQEKIHKELTASDITTIVETSIKLEVFVYLLKGLGRQFPNSGIKDALNECNLFIEVFQEISIKLFANKIEEMLRKTQSFIKSQIPKCENGSQAVRQKGANLAKIVANLEFVLTSMQNDGPSSFIQNYNMMDNEYAMARKQLSADENAVLENQLKSIGYPIVLPEIAAAQKVDAAEAHQMPLIEIKRRQVIVDWYLRHLCDKIKGISDKNNKSKDLDETELKKFDQQAEDELKKASPKLLWEKYSIVRKLQKQLNEPALKGHAKLAGFDELLFANSLKLLTHQRQKVDKFFRKKTTSADDFMLALGAEVDAAKKSKDKNPHPRPFSQ